LENYPVKMELRKGSIPLPSILYGALSSANQALERCSPQEESEAKARLSRAWILYIYCPKLMSR